MGKFSSGTPYQNISSQFSAVIDIIKTLGFVNHPYEFNYEATPPRIEITVTPRDGQSDPFKMYFIPLDSYCYKLPV